MKSDHQQRVEDFMQRSGQVVRLTPDQPTDAECLLRARLIFEEAMETIHALGVDVVQDGQIVGPYVDFEISAPFQLVEAVDGCCDLKVVTTGTLSAMGVHDTEVQLVVDTWNLRKFGPGSFKDVHGKWQKPPGFQGPNPDLHEFLTLVKKASTVNYDPQTGLPTFPKDFVTLVTEVTQTQQKPKQ